MRRNILQVNSKSFHYQLLDVTGLYFSNITVCKYFTALALRYILFLSFVYSSGILGLVLSNDRVITSGPQAFLVTLALTYWLTLVVYFIIEFSKYLDNIKCSYITVVFDSDK